MPVSSNLYLLVFSVVFFGACQPATSPAATVTRENIATPKFQSTARPELQVTPTQAKSSDLGTWSSGLPLQVSRGEVAAATIEDRIYVIGGFGGSNVVEEFQRG